MKSLLLFLIIIMPTSLCCCTNNNEKKVQQKTTLSISKTDSLYSDTGQLRKQDFEEDTIKKENSKDSLISIKNNFKRINAIKKWTIKTTDEAFQSSEGGETKFYYHDKKLEKIATVQFGEMFQMRTEYYLLNNQLSFILERLYRYNRPIYYDATAQKENNDSEAFDLKKSTIIETRSYFEDGKLIQQTSTDSKLKDEQKQHLTEEQKRIKGDFEKLIKLAKTM